MRMPCSLWILVLATGIIALAPCNASAQVSPPSRVWVDPLPQGGALAVSWDAEGTNATTFHVYLFLEDAGLVPIGTGTAEAARFIHAGLVDGIRYTYVVMPDDSTGAPRPPGSLPVSGVPVNTSGSSACLPPVLDPIAGYVRTANLEVTGRASHPGAHLEVEAIPMGGGMAINASVVSDNVTGRFAARIVVSVGANLVHARCNGDTAQPGPWSNALYVVLDIDPPILRIAGADEEYECGGMVLITAAESTDDHGISSVEWRLTGRINLTVTAPIFTFAFTDVGEYPILVVVTDLAGNAAETTVSVGVVPFDEPPRIIGRPEVIKLIAGGTARMRLSSWVEDVDDPLGDLVWSVSGGDSNLFTSTVDGDVLTLVGVREVDGEGVLSVLATDPAGKSVNFTVRIEVGRVVKSGSNAWVALLGGAVPGTLTAGAVTVWLRRRDARRQPMKAIEEPPFFVKGLYLIHNDGRLMLDVWATTGGIKGPEVVSSMLTAIQDFVRDSFEDGGAVDTIMFGSNHLMLTRGDHVFIASVTAGAPSQDYRAMARAVVGRIEAKYAGILEDWDGSTSRLGDLKEILKGLVEQNKGRTLEEVLRNYQPTSILATPTMGFQHGLVRYQLDVVNHTESVLVDAFVNIEWDREVLSLKRAKHEGERFGNRFHLGNIQPNGRQTLKLYFDPHTCLISFIKGMLAYTDVRGKLQSFTLESTMVEVNCPVFFTVGNANTAMLHRLVEEDLAHADNVVIRFTSAISSEVIYKIAKSVLSGYDIKFVQEYTTESPFMGEAWYYGETKIHDYRVVVRATVREEDRTMEFFVASTLPTTITGLLAELNRLFHMKLDEKYSKGSRVHKIVSRTVSDETTEDDRDMPVLFGNVVSGAVRHVELDKRRDELATVRSGH